MPLPSDIQRKLREKEERLRELEIAKRNLENQQIRKEREKQLAVTKAKNEGRKLVLEKVKSVIPATAPSYFKPMARALLSDVQRIIKEEEKRIAKET